MNTRLSAALLAMATVSVTLLAGCSSGGKNDASPTPPGSASAAPTSPTSASTAQPSTDARDAVRKLAATALNASYTASYELTSDELERASTTALFVTPGSLRIDVRTADATVQYFSTEQGAFNCAMQSWGERLCEILGNPAEVVPAGINPAVQRLFVSSVAALAGDAEVDVADIGAGPSADGVQTSRCFAVTTPPIDDLVSGTYCFTADGALTRAELAGTQLQITHLGAGPGGADFTLPAGTVRVEG